MILEKKIFGPGQTGFLVEFKVIFLEFFTMAPIVKGANFERLCLGREASDRETVFTTRCAITRSIFENFFVGVDFSELSLTPVSGCWSSRRITLNIVWQYGILLL